MEKTGSLLAPPPWFHPPMALPTVPHLPKEEVLDPWTPSEHSSKSGEGGAEGGVEPGVTPPLMSPLPGLEGGPPHLPALPDPRHLLHLLTRKVRRKNPKKFPALAQLFSLNFIF